MERLRKQLGKLKRSLSFPQCENSGGGNPVFAQVRTSLFLIFFLISLPNCGFLGFGSSATGDSSTVTGAGGEEGGSGSSGSGSGSSDSGSGSYVPSSGGSIPIGYVVKSEKTIVAAADSESEVPVIGYDGAVETTYTDTDGTTTTMTDSDSDGVIDDYQIAVSTSEITDTTTAICDQTGVECCDITTAGGFECFVSGSNSDTFYAYVTDGSTVSEKISDTVNTSLLYLGAAPTDVAASEYGLDLTDLGITEGGVVMTLANEKIIPIVNDNGSFMVKGNHADNYALANATGADKLAFNPSQNYLSNMVTDTGLNYSEFDPRTFDFGTWGQETNTGALSFTAIKPSMDTDFLFRYAFEPISTDQSRGFICSFSATSSCSADTINNQVHFFEAGDLASGANNQKTISFDTDDYNVALVLFQDTDDKINLGAGYSNSFRAAPVTLDTANGSSYDFVVTDFGDLISYLPQTLTTGGRALLLDKNNSKVWFIDYFVDRVGHSSSITSSLVTGTNSVSVGSNSQGIILNADKTKAYVASQGDDKIYVIDLSNVKDIATTFDINNVSISTLTLSDYIGDKSVTLTPNSITYQTISDGDAATTDPEYLLIGLQGIKTNLVIEL